MLREKWVETHCQPAPGTSQLLAKWLAEVGTVPAQFLMLFSGGGRPVVSPALGIFLPHLSLMLVGW